MRLRPRPGMVYISQGRTVLATDLEGLIRPAEDLGLFVYQTRLLSDYRYLINGTAPQPVALSPVDQHSWLGYYIVTAPERPRHDPAKAEGEEDVSGDPTLDTLELRVSRTVGPGLHEDLDVTNFSPRATAFRLEVVLDADFADRGETAGPRQQVGTVTRDWRRGDEGWELAVEYRVEHAYDHGSERGVATLQRGVVVRVQRAETEPAYQEGRLRFEIDLAPRSRWHTCLLFAPTIDGQTRTPPLACRAFDVPGSPTTRSAAFQGQATGFLTRDPPLAGIVREALQRAVADLASLRLEGLHQNGRAWTMAAGVPVFTGLYGRDTLTVAWQGAMLGPEMMEGTLPELARWQGGEVNDWRDEQPGRMLHEAQWGPLAALNITPNGRYYGSITTSGFYPVVLSALWHWTGDRDLVRPYIGPALTGLSWLDRDADLDHDGFYEYLTRSPNGLRHQGWKDSGDAIVAADGSQVEPPIATCEEQAFVYVAKLHLAEVLWWLGERTEARRLFREARELKKRFNDAFWMDDAGFFALGLDPGKRQIQSISSNPGHCLAAGIIDRSLARRTADRLMADDLFSGWGVRTLSADHPAYNPYSYHRGTIWPVENASFALGLLRHGLHEHLERLCRAQFELAALYEFNRLPELLCGHPRDADHPFPALYPKANSPQAWSASAVFMLLQSMLGLYPYAPLRTLFVDPHLPEWLPEITVRDLRVGKAEVSIRFFRTDSGASDYRVLDHRGHLHVLRQPSPWSLTASWGERLGDALASLLPGR